MTTYLANFDFDTRLAGKAGGAQPRPAAPDPNIVLWRLVTAPGDRILVPGLEADVVAPALGPLSEVTFSPPDHSCVAEFTPWGVDVLARRLAGNRFSESTLETVSRLNDRVFAFEVDPLPGSFVTTDATRVLDLAANGKRLMLKPRFGGFGRGLRRVLGIETDENLKNWVVKRCREGGLLVEPLLQSGFVEWADHWDLHDSGDQLASGATYLGRTTLHCDPHGQFVASIADPAETGTNHSDEQALDITRLPTAIATARYSGPLSIDRCLYTWNGEQKTNLFRDINARWTVGRLALLASQRQRERVAIERLKPHPSHLASTTPAPGDSNQLVIPIPPLCPGDAPRWQLTVGTPASTERTIDR